MSSPSFTAGQQVVCVFDHFPPGVQEYFNALPREGHTYTIDSVFVGIEHTTGRRIASVRLREVPAIIPARAGFSSWRFRLLEAEPSRTAREFHGDLVPG